MAALGFNTSVTGKLNNESVWVSYKADNESHNIDLSIDNDNFRMSADLNYARFCLITSEEKYKTDDYSDVLDWDVSTLDIKCFNMIAFAPTGSNTYYYLTRNTVDKQAIINKFVFTGKPTYFIITTDNGKTLNVPKIPQLVLTRGEGGVITYAFEFVDLEAPLRDYMQKQIDAFASYYIVRDTEGHNFRTVHELTTVTTVYSLANDGTWKSRIPTKNDYCIVETDEVCGKKADNYTTFTTTAQYVGYYILKDENRTHVTDANKDSLGIIPGTTIPYVDLPITRYIYTKTEDTYNPNNWHLQYIIGEDGITEAQLKAMNSGITEEKRIGYDNLVTHVYNLDLAQVGSDGNYIKLVSQADGQLSATKQAFDTVVGDAADDKNAPTTKAIKTYVDEKIKGIDVDPEGTEKETYLTTIYQQDGVIKATSETRVTELTHEVIPEDEKHLLPTQAAVKTYVDAEETRATQAETTLTTNLNAEISRADTEEKRLDRVKQNKLTAGKNVTLNPATTDNKDETPVVISVTNIDDAEVKFTKDIWTTYSWGQYNGTIDEPKKIEANGKDLKYLLENILTTRHAPDVIQPHWEVTWPEETVSGATFVNKYIELKFNLGTYQYDAKTGVKLLWAYLYEDVNEIDLVISGYYKDNKFYLDKTYTTEITPTTLARYIDITTAKIYKYAENNFVEVEDIIINYPMNITVPTTFSRTIYYSYSQGNIPHNNIEEEAAAKQILAGTNLQKDIVKAYPESELESLVTKEPTFTITVSPIEDYEAGTEITPTYKITGEDVNGYYEFGSTTNPESTSAGLALALETKTSEAGSAYAEAELDTLYDFKAAHILKDEIETADQVTITVKDTWSDGLMPRTPYNNKVTGKQISGKTITVDSLYTMPKGYRKLFYGYTNTNELTSDIIRGLTAQKNGPLDVLVNEDTTKKYIVIAAPKNTRTLKEVTLPSSSNAVVTSEFKKQSNSIAIKGANNYTARDYDIWIYAPDKMAGSYRIIME